MGLPPSSNAARLVQLMLRDKKATDGLTFVLDGPRGLEVVKGVTDSMAADVLRAMGAV
jgi:5-deoxy-5-amino-3-dehydroquinate synthase